MISNDDEQLNNYDQVDETYEDELVDQAEAADESDAQVVKKRSKAEYAINAVLWLTIIALAVMVVLRLFVFNSVAVLGASMTPTYENNEIVVVNKLATVKRGDVAVFYLRDVDDKFKAMFAGADECGEGQPYEKLIKRVVATAGDKIWVRRVSGDGMDGTYEVIVETVDGDRLTENYYVKKGEQLPAENFLVHTLAATGLGNLENCTESNPYVVKKGCFYAMGDHRENSVDSRMHGEFPLSRLFGVVINK